MSADDRDIPGVVAPPPLIYFVPFMLSFVPQRFWPLRFIPRVVTWWLGGPMLLGGIALNAWALATMHRAGTPIEPWHPAVKVVTTGPFAWSRNPIYVSLAVIYGAIALLARNFWALLLLPLVLTIMRRGVIEREERYLRRRFEDVYGPYSARVRRWV